MNAPCLLYGIGRQNHYEYVDTWIDSIVCNLGGTID